MKKMLSFGLAAVCMAASADNSGPGEEIGRKLSVKELGWGKPEIQALVIAQQAQSHFLARFVGQANGLKPYVNEKGETQFGLIGQFKGTSRDGEEKSGTILYLPGYVQDAIAAALSSEDAAAVNIAVDVYAGYDADAATSYVFTARNLIPVENPVVKQLEQQIGNIPLPALAAPSDKK